MFQKTIGSAVCAFAALGAFGCGTSDAGAPSDDADSTEPHLPAQPDGTAAAPTLLTTGTPAYFAPQPGLLVASPAALSLGRGQGVSLKAARVNSAGQAAANGTLSWVSSDPQVVAIDASGKITAVGDGVALLRVTDADGHESSVSVAVSAEPLPPQPFALSCALPVRTARPGEAVALEPIITGPDGQPLQERVTLAYSVRGNAGASISSAGIVSAERGGVAIVSASIPLADGGATPLAGDCIITFGNPEPAADDPSAAQGSVSGGSVGGSAAPSCDKKGKVAYCSLIDAPILVRGAGQTQRLKAAIFRETGCGFGDVPAMEVGAPSAVKLGIKGVVDVGADGLFRSLGPGLATYQASVEGVDCAVNGVSVDIDPSGSWSAACANGDRGSLTISRVPPYIITRMTTMGYPALSVNGCFENPNDSFSCSGAAAVYPTFSLKYIQHQQDYRCDETTRCFADGNTNTCRDVREPVLERENLSLRVTGPDSFEIQNCKYTRGTSGGKCGGGGTSGEYQGTWQDTCTYSYAGETETASANGLMGISIDSGNALMHFYTAEDQSRLVEFPATVNPDGTLQAEYDNCTFTGSVNAGTASGAFVCDDSDSDEYGSYTDICQGTWSATRTTGD